MTIKEIIVLGEDLSTPHYLREICFVTEKICGVYVNSTDELQFTTFDLLNFYDENKEYVERIDILNSGKFHFGGELINVQHPENIDYQSLINHEQYQ